MEGQIIEISEQFDDIECKTIYKVIILFDNIPPIKLGKAEIKQKKHPPKNDNSQPYNTDR